MFKIGDIVVCIDDNIIIKPTGELVKYKKYEVTDINHNNTGIQINSSYYHYKTNRFISIKEYRKIKLEKLELC